MAGAIAHRGPDDEGFWADEAAGISFGHRRLSIVDLSPQGHQPMVSADGRWVINYNGEIYNHAELRAELDTAGATPSGGWRGHSDTETLIEAIARWGLEGALSKSVGMFAFALWDRRDRRLSLVRDRFGEKPLYYGWAGRDLVFGSELKALRQHPAFNSEIDRAALSAFASLGYVPAPSTIYRGTFKLPPGCILTMTTEAEPLSAPPAEGVEGPISLRRYWAYREIVRDGLDRPYRSQAEALSELDKALEVAIRGQSVADVPVGAFLSGGIDSSTIVGLYQKYSAAPVRTYSIGFEEAGYDEAGYAKQVANHFGTIHTEHYVGASEARDVIPSLPRMYDEPFADASQVPTFLVSQFARNEVTVALTGDGGDELFGGYNRHFLVPQWWRRIDRVPKVLRAAAGATAAKIPSGLWSASSRLGGSVRPDMGAKLKRAAGIAGSADCVEDVYRGLLNQWTGAAPVLGGQAMPPTELLGQADAPDEVRLMYADAVGYLPDDILCKVDRASMAVSLETRVPFLDHRVAAVAARIPIGMKVSDGVGKRILRDILYREAPRQMFERPKSGFAMPVGEWIKGPLRGWAEDLLDPVRLRQEGWFDPEQVRRRWQNHLSGKQDAASAIWAILMFQAWLREASE